MAVLGRFGHLRFAGFLLPLIVASSVVVAGCSPSTAVRAAGPSVSPAENQEVAAPQSKPLALVYRGPASCPGCSESAAAMLAGSRFHFRVAYIGPGEKLRFTSQAFVGVTMYVQPGGDTSVARADRLLGASAQALIRNYVAAGGRYLGICQGAYLAGTQPGMGILAGGDTGQYITSRGAQVRTTADTTVDVIMGKARGRVFFQDGPYIVMPKGRAGVVLATYTNGLVAGAAVKYGRGLVTVTGPHPEAPRSWFVEADILASYQPRFASAYAEVLLTAALAK